MSVDQRFRPREHIRRQSDFTRTYTRGRRAGDGVLVVYLIENGLAWSRLGLSVGRRVGNSPKRNYVKRRIREAFRVLKGDLPRAFDIICVAKPQGRGRSQDYAESLANLLKRATKPKKPPKPGQPPHRAVT